MLGKMNKFIRTDNPFLFLRFYWIGGNEVDAGDEQSPYNCRNISMEFFHEIPPNPS
jgi:hypothetical protein